jgi:hypothetical protein
MSVVIKDPKPIGRPSVITPEVITEVCDRIALGESLRQICESDHMPGMTTILRAVSEDGEFRTRYARAQTQRGENIMSELLVLCDTPPKDNVEAQHRRLQVDTRKWVISKLYPKKYGDKTETIHSGEVKLEKVTRTIVDPKKG